MTSIDSFLASSMNPQVLTTITSASSGSMVKVIDASCRCPSIISESTRFLGQPKVTKWTRALSSGEVHGMGDGIDRISSEQVLCALVITRGVSIPSDRLRLGDGLRRRADKDQPSAVRRPRVGAE